MTKFILVGFLFFSYGANALPNACDPTLSFNQILETAREVVFTMPVQVRIQVSPLGKDFLTTTTAQFRVKRSSKPTEHFVDVAYETSWGSSSTPYPNYLDSTIINSRIQRTLKVSYPKSNNNENVSGVTVAFEGNKIKILDFIHDFENSSTYLAAPSESCITASNTVVIN